MSFPPKRSELPQHLKLVHVNRGSTSSELKVKLAKQQAAIKPLMSGSRSALPTASTPAPPHDDASAATPSAATPSEPTSVKSSPAKASSQAPLARSRSREAVLQQVRDRMEKQPLYQPLRAGGAIENLSSAYVADMWQRNPLSRVNTNQQAAGSLTRNGSSSRLGSASMAATATGASRARDDSTPAAARSGDAASAAPATPGVLSPARDSTTASRGRESSVKPVQPALTSGRRQQTASPAPREPSSGQAPSAPKPASASQAAHRTSAAPSIVKDTSVASAAASRASKAPAPAIGIAPKVAPRTPVVLSARKPVVPATTTSKKPSGAPQPLRPVRHVDPTPAPAAAVAPAAESSEPTMSAAEATPAATTTTA